MSIDIERDIDGNEQQSSFQNATQQSGPPGYEFSIAVHLDVPLIGVYDQDTLAQFIERTFEPISDDPRVSIHVQMGREGSGERWYLEEIHGHAIEELPRNDELVEVIQTSDVTATLVAEKPGHIMSFIRLHWGTDDEGWLNEIENEIDYGVVPTPFPPYVREEA